MGALGREGPSVGISGWVSVGPGVAQQDLGGLSAETGGVEGVCLAAA